MSRSLYIRLSAALAAVLVIALIVVTFTYSQFQADGQSDTLPSVLMLPALVRGPIAAFSVQTTSARSMVNIGNRNGLTVKVTYTGAGNRAAMVVLTVRDARNVHVYEKRWSLQMFQSNQSILLLDGFTPAVNAALGTHTISVQITNDSARTTYFNNRNALSFSVIAAGLESTVTPTRPAAPSSTPTDVATATAPATSTSTPSPTATSQPSATPVATSTSTSTSTPTSTSIPTSTSTDTPQPTNTATPPPTATARPSATPNTGPRAGFYGLNWHPIWYDSAWIVNQLNQMQQAGVQRTRVDVNWDALETSKGIYDSARLASLDSVVNESAKRGIKTLLIVLRSPGWANGNQDPRTPPNNDQDYANFLTFLMQRYSNKVNDYEIWNEPDGYWAWNNPNPARYTALLKTAYTSAKAINPNVNILGGSLSGWYADQSNFLRGMYAAGAQGYFDTLSAHAYGDPPQHGNLTPELMLSQWNAVIPAIMAANGDGAKRIWMTEQGYTTSTTGVNEATQADYLTRVYSSAKMLAKVDNLFYFEWMNSDGGGDITQSSQNYGIVSITNARKLTYGAYQSAARLP